MAQSLPTRIEAKPQTNVLQSPVANLQPVEDTVLSEPTSEPKMRVFANLVRIILKVILTVWLIWTGNSAWLAMGICFFISEVVEIIIDYYYKKEILPKPAAAILSSVASVMVIDIFLIFGNAIESVFYALYFVHMTTALSRFQKVGALSAGILSIISYSTLLIFVHAAPIAYFFLFFLVLIGWRMIDIGRLVDELYTERRRVLAIEKMKNDLIAIISHNLRTPIAALKGYIEILLRGDTGKLSNDQSTIIKNVDQNLKRLEEVAEEIISLSIFESKSYDIIPTKENYRAVVEEVLEETRVLADKKGLTLTDSVTNEIIPELLIDRKKIKNVLTNLIDNAIKFTEKGGVTITVRKTDDSIETEVADTGIGISKDQQATLFDKFHRIGNILVYDYKGAGLGLYICKTVIELHHGKIWAESEEGKGTCITFTLPIPKV